MEGGGRRGVDFFVSFAVDGARSLSPGGESSRVVCRFTKNWRSGSQSQWSSASQQVLPRSNLVVAVKGKWGWLD